VTRLHREAHQIERIGWLRAAVLGANDGIVSTASLIVGVALGGGAPPLRSVVRVTFWGAVAMAVTIGALVRASLA